MTIKQPQSTRSHDHDPVEEAFDRIFEYCREAAEGLESISGIVRDFEQAVYGVTVIDVICLSEGSPWSSQVSSDSLLCAELEKTQKSCDSD